MEAALIIRKAHITHITDPSNFWMRLGTDADFQDFAGYQDTLNNFYNQTGRKDSTSADTLSIGDCVMVADTGQGEGVVDFDGESNTEFHWNRAKVLRVDGNQVDIFYVDLGFTKIVNMSHVKNIHRDLFEYLPPQAVKFGMAGIRPLSFSWTSRAVAMFESQVLDKELVVCISEYDEDLQYGKVAVYTQQTDSSWHCLTHEMLKEEFGLPTDPLPVQILSHQVVQAALIRAEQELESVQSPCPDESDGDGDDEDEEEVSQGQEVTVVPAESFKSPHQSDPHSFAHVNTEALPTLTSVQASPDKFSNTSPGDDHVNVGVSAFNLNSFESTRRLSLTKMQQDKVKQQRQQTRARLEQELDDSEDDNAPVAEIEWGKSDLHIGKPGLVADVQSSIKRELYRHNPGSEDDWHDFLKGVQGVNTTSILSAFAAGDHRGQKKYNDKVPLKPLTEPEDYKIQKKIEEILLGKDGGELEMVCVLVNSVIEPDIKVPYDRLVAVFTAILELMVRDPNMDPLIAFGVLETYLETIAFNESLDIVLKALRRKFVKVSPNSHLILHCSFAEVLANLFIRSANWPTSTCAVVHEFAMSSLECWAVFNKLRAQNSESSMSLEFVYLECIETFIKNSWQQLNRVFPERCRLLQEEMRQKLINDGTDRNIRAQLLNVLLKLNTASHPAAAPATYGGASYRDGGVQTEWTARSGARKDSDQRQGSPELTGFAGCDPVFYKCAKSYQLNSSSESFNPGTNASDKDYVDEDTQNSFEDIENLNTSFTSDIHFLGSCNDLHISDHSVQQPSGSSVRRKSDGQLSKDGLLKNNRALRLPKNFFNLPPRLQKKFFRDHGFDVIEDGPSAGGKMDNRNYYQGSNEIHTKVNTTPPLSRKDCQKQRKSGNTSKVNYRFIHNSQTLKKEESPDLIFSSQSGTDEPQVPLIELVDPERCNQDSNSLPNSLPPVDFTDEHKISSEQNISKVAVQSQEQDISLIDQRLDVLSGEEYIQDYHSNCLLSNVDEMADPGRDVSSNDEEVYVSACSSASSTRKEQESTQIGDLPLSPHAQVPVSYVDVSTPLEKGITEADLGRKDQESDVADRDQTEINFGKKDWEHEFVDKEQTEIDLGRRDKESEVYDSEQVETKLLAGAQVDVISEGVDRELMEPFNEDLITLNDPVGQNDEVKPELCDREDMRYKYTARELKALRTNCSAHPRAMATMTDLYELVDGIPYQRIIVEGKVIERKKPAPPPSEPLHRYTGSGHPPQPVSTSPISNAGKWKSLSELLPPSRLRNGEVSQNLTNFAGSDWNKNKLEFPTYVKSSSLKDIAECLVPALDPVDQASLQLDDYDVGYGLNGDKMNAETCTSPARNADKQNNMRWPDNFFQAAKLSSKEAQFSSNVSDLAKPGSAANKKKKTKFRPINDFTLTTEGRDLTETSQMTTLLMTEEDVGGQILHQPRLGALAASSSKRSSLFADKVERPKADSWMPGRRKCTRCGSERHTIYECVEDDPLQKMTYMLG